MWIKLDSELLKANLAESERNILNSIEIDTDVENILNETCDNIAEMWRGRLRSVKIPVDKREGYIPSEYLYFILVHVRYSAYTRLPAMGELLDELRRREWERANEIFDDPHKIKPKKPEEEEEPEDEAGDPVVIPNEHSWRF